MPRERLLLRELALFGGESTFLPLYYFWQGA
jgi:hypothetical protein